MIGSPFANHTPAARVPNNYQLKSCQTSFEMVSSQLAPLARDHQQSEPEEFEASESRANDYCQPSDTQVNCSPALADSPEPMPRDAAVSAISSQPPALPGQAENLVSHPSFSVRDQRPSMSFVDEFDPNELGVSIVCDAADINNPVPCVCPSYKPASHAEPERPKPVSDPGTLAPKESGTSVRHAAPSPSPRQPSSLSRRRVSQLQVPQQVKPITKTDKPVALRDKVTATSRKATPKETSRSVKPLAPPPPSQPSTPSHQAALSARNDQQPRFCTNDLKPIEFGVSVIRDSEDTLDGLFAGTVTKDGLSLRQKNTTFHVPIGTVAEYRRCKRIMLDLPERQIEIEILGRAPCSVYWLGQNLYVQRLASDVARFLSGERKCLWIPDYKIPGYFTVLALLPIGLSAAAICAYAFNPEDWRGMLNNGFWALSGVLLTALCVRMISKEQWSTAKRAGLSGCANVLGYGGFALLTMTLRGGHAEWNEFTPPGAGFTALMPGAPNAVERMVPSPAGQLSQHVFMLERKRERDALSIMYQDYPPSMLVQGCESVFESVEHAFVVNIKGKLVKSREIAMGSIPGREVEIDVQGKGRMMARYYLNGHRFYQIIAIGPRLGPDSETVRKLFNSFTICDAK